MTALSNLQTAASTPPIGLSFPAIHRFSVDEYHCMIENGILGENDRVELIDGWIVEMSPIGPPHATCVSMLAALLYERLPEGWIVRAQCPITTANSEPEPDIVVAKGSFQDFGVRHPGSADIGLLIEVADASLNFDRQQKRRQYALANIAEYWIVNLVNRRLETHRRPLNGEYSAVEAIDSTARATCEVPELATVSFSVAEILP